MSKQLSPWQEWKKNLGSTRPWDLVNPNTNWASEELSSKRFSICKECPEFINLTTQCKKCGCVMSRKTKLQQAECPLHKW
jgi:hypothetical protein